MKGIVALKAGLCYTFPGLEALDMKNFTLFQALNACGGQMLGHTEEDRELGRVVIDSRKVEPGDLFVAYKGEKTDGHVYVSTALDKGAAACLVEHPVEGETRPQILVPDVQKALERIAAAYRKTLSLPVIGITGSVGKTSAKEMIAAVLSSRYSVLKTEGNLNNQIGVPMTLSRIEPEHDAAVVEMGISGFGEMSTLAEMARPTIGVFTVIGHAHLEFLHDLDGVFRAKTEMLSYLPKDGTVIVNGDDPYLKGLRCGQRKLCVGQGEDCDVRAVDIHPTLDGKTACTIVYGSRRVAVQIPAFGKHMICAALEGAAVGFVMGLSDAEIAEGISRFHAVGRRAAVGDTGFVTLIDDSYNANPDSVKCGIDSLMTLPGRHVAILGDMLEMGETGKELHEDVGRYAREKGVDALYASGPLGRWFVEGFGTPGRYFESQEALIAALPELLRKGDAVLVKASLGMHYDKVVEGIRQL